MIPAIAVGFFLLAGLLLWFVIGGRGRLTPKLAAIVVSSAFTFVVWGALDTFSGWPTRQSPPERALLVGSAVDEPRAIYLWLLPSEEPGLLAYKPDAIEPRAYRLPYSRQLHAQVDSANALARRGQRVELRRVRPERADGPATRSILRAYRLPSPAGSKKDQVSWP